MVVGGGGSLCSIYPITIDGHFFLLQGNEIIQKLQTELRSVKSKVYVYSEYTCNNNKHSDVDVPVAQQNILMLYFKINSKLCFSVEVEEHGDDSAGETARREGDGR